MASVQSIPRLSVALAALLLSCTGCAVVPFSGQRVGSSSDRSTARAVAAYQGPDRSVVLEAGARAEGRLHWYTALAAAANPLAEAFQRAYPFIGVEVYRASNPDLLARILAETEAGRPTFDVAESNLAFLMALKERGLLTPYFSSHLGAYPAAATEPAEGGLAYWVLARESYIGFAYNSHQLAPSALPTTYRDLLRPELRGNMALDGADSGVRLVGNLLTHQGLEFVEQLAKQDLGFHTMSNQGLADLVVRGEVPSSPSMARNNVTAAARLGAPVSWLSLEPVTVTTGGGGISSNALHPHAAALFADFLLGPEARQIFDGLDYGNPSRPAGFRRWEPERGLSSNDFESKYAAWSLQLKSTFQRR